MCSPRFRRLRPLVRLFRASRRDPFLELCTSWAGEADVLSDLPDTVRIGVGVVDQKSGRVEPPEEIVSRAERAIALFGPDRVLLNPDCGFATFADKPHHPRSRLPLPSWSTTCARPLMNSVRLRHSVFSV